MKKWILRLVQLGLLAVALYSGYQIADYFISRNKSDAQYKEVANIIDEIRGDDMEISLVKEDKDSNPDKTVRRKRVEKGTTQVNYQEMMAKLTAMNPDTVCYLDIQGTNSHYPVVQASDNDFYLWRGFDGVSNLQGTPFMDFENNRDFQDKNSVIYGHTMYYGDAMFGVLKNYYDQSYVDESPQTFTITTLDGIYVYQIFSVYRVPADAPYRLPNMADEDWINFLDETLNKSAADFGFDRLFTQEDKIVTLSTCTDDHHDDFRTAVAGILVEVQQAE